MMETFKKLFGAESDTPDTASAETPAAAQATPDNNYEAWSPSAGRADPPPAASGGEETPAVTEEAAGTAAPVDSEPAGLEARIIDAIRLVYDPEIPVNIYELGLIYGIDIGANNDVHVQMTLTAPGCPVAGDMPGWVAMAIESNVEDAGEVDVEVVWDPPWTPDMMSEAAQLELGYL